MKRWYYYKWRFNSPAEWWIDLLLIDQVVRDAVATIQPEYWRFHRRSGQDEASHQFTFFVLCEEKDNQEIQSAIKSNQILQKIQDLVIDQSHGINGDDGRLSVTSDPKWPSLLGENWIPFMTGLCKTYLLMVVDSVGNRQKKLTNKSDFGAINLFYRYVANDLDEVWREWGGHAFFHQTNAVFGYGAAKVSPMTMYMVA